MLVVITKAIKILFRREKAIKIITFRYTSQYLFDKSYVIIQVVCKNALWYQYGEITTTKEKVALNISRLKEKQVIVTIQGLFRKRIYKLEIKPHYRLNTNSFKNTVPKLGQNITFLPIVLISYPAIQITTPFVQIKHRYTNIIHTLYNQADFI
jgi:hypothetical protein